MTSVLQITFIKITKIFACTNGKDFEISYLIYKNYCFRMLFNFNFSVTCYKFLSLIVPFI